jgi:membrane-bound inhibitor of C-type lysozyme
VACAAPPAEHSIAASFACEGGKKIQAVFATGAQPRVMLTLSDGREMELPQTLSASGARYASRDESFVFWNKGRTAFVEEAGRQTYMGCVQTTS